MGMMFSIQAKSLAAIAVLSFCVSSPPKSLTLNSFLRSSYLAGSLSDIVGIPPPSCISAAYRIPDFVDISLFELVRFPVGLFPVLGLVRGPIGNWTRKGNGQSLGVSRENQIDRDNDCVEFHPVVNIRDRREVDLSLPVSREG